MNGKTGVTREVELRVREAMLKLGYQRLRRPKRSLKGNLDLRRPSKPIGCWLPSNRWGNSIWHLAVGAAAQRLQEHGYPVSLHVGPDDDAAATGPHETVPGFAGWIMADRRPDQLAALRATAAAGLPCVRMGYFPLDVQVPQVVCDAVLGTLALMEHLIGRGHRRIAYLRAGVPESRPAGYRETNDVEKAAAYTQALLEHGLGWDPNLVFTARYSPERVEAAIQMIASLRPAPTALLIDNDWTTATLLSILRNKGLDLIRGLEIAHVIDTPQDPQAYGFTCAQVPTARLGVVAADVLLRSLSGNPYPSDLVLKVAPRIITAAELSAAR